MSWNDIPTCKEEGLDMQYLMLRAMFLPGKMTPEQTTFYVDLFKKVTQTPEYKDYMEKQALKPVFLTGKDMLAFLEEDDTLNKNLMIEAGFARSRPRASRPSHPSGARCARRRRADPSGPARRPHGIERSRDRRRRSGRAVDTSRRRDLHARVEIAFTSCSSRSRSCSATTTGAAGWAGRRMARRAATCRSTCA